MGAWIEIAGNFIETAIDAVAPLVGAWIEMSFGQGVSGYNESLPSWERGLKYKSNRFCGLGKNVAPLVGAWIEIMERIGRRNMERSLPSWERGLK